MALKYDTKLFITLFFTNYSLSSFPVHLRSALRTPGCLTPELSSAHHTAAAEAQTPPSMRATDGTRASNNWKRLYFDHGHLKCKPPNYVTPCEMCYRFYPNVEFQ